MADADGDSQARRRRAAKACEFCRKRKMKCDDERPKCTNCKLYGKECLYTELPRKSRPMRDRLATLEEQNRQLQARLGGTPSNGFVGSSTTEDLGSASSQGNIGEEETMSSNVSSTSPAQQSVAGPSQLPASNLTGQPAIGSVSQSSYYGRTSALFDEDPSDGRAPWANRQAAEFTRRQLMGEAAHQRQLETLNYNAGKLDFDGVDPETGKHLLDLHWNRQHHSHLITYRPAFMRDMACRGPYFSKLLLNAIYFGSCKFSPRENLKGIHIRFRERVRELLGASLDRSAITTIQAMLVMTNSLFALGDERSAAWIYAGIAFRMLIDLGAHVDGLNSKTTEEDLEIRRRVFWGAFVVDKIQSLYQGRPVSIQEADVRVPILFQDQYEELEHWTPFAYPDTESYPGSPAYSVSTFTELCKLSVIMNAILNNVYGVKSSKRAPQTLTEDLESMQKDLEKWKIDLPVHLDFDPSITPCRNVPPPHVLSLHAMYNVLLILLHRPFVSEGHLYSMSPSIASNSFSICAQAATRTVQLLRIYQKTFSIRHAPYLIAYATYVASTIHVRIAAQLGPGSESYNSLRTCCSVFAKNQDTNWAARRAQTVILNLMKKMNIELDVNEATPDTRIYSDAAHSSNGLNTPAEPNMQNPGSNPSSHDSVVDLDMDAILRSFTTEQQQIGEFQPQELQRMHQPGLLPNFQQQLPGDAFAQQWTMFDLAGDETFDDTLFGFNSAALDGMWQQ